MASQYKNPPIIEAICDIQFSESQRKWNSTIPGLFYGKIEDRFPDEPEEQESFETKLEISPGGKSDQQTRSLGKRVLFNNSSESIKVSIRENGLGCHSLSPYKGWTIFKGNIQANFNAYRELMNPIGISRIGIRYINKIVMNADIGGKASLSDFFTEHPSVIRIDETTPTFISKYVLRKQTVLEFESENISISSSFVDGKSAGFTDSMCTILDLDVFCSWNDNGLPLEQAMDKIEQLRDIERKAFESLITDHAREVFNGD